MLYLLIFSVFLFGLIIGSFLNCLAWRLYKEESIWGRSYCPRCKHQIRWYDNVPVLSFFILRGKCRDCGQGISWQYPMGELVTGVLFVLAFLVNIHNVDSGQLLSFSAQGGPASGGQFSIFNFQTISNFQYLIFPLFTFHFILSILFYWFVISVMVLIFIIDARWYLILDVVTLPAMAAVLIFNLLLGMDWQNLLISGIIGASFFLFQYLVSRGRWIGGGDIRLGALMGLILGWPVLLCAILLAYIGGSIVGLALMAAGRKQWGSKIPLGAFLAPATLIALFWGQELIDRYFDMMIF